MINVFIESFFLLENNFRESLSSARSGPPGMRTAFRLFSARFGGPAEQKAENGKVKIALIPCFFQPDFAPVRKEVSKETGVFPENGGMKA